MCLLFRQCRLLLFSSKSGLEKTIRGGDIKECNRGSDALSRPQYTSFPFPRFWLVFEVLIRQPCSHATPRRRMARRDTRLTQLCAESEITSPSLNVCSNHKNHPGGMQAAEVQLQFRHVELINPITWRRPSASPLPVCVYLHITYMVLVPAEITILCLGAFSQQK